MMIQKDISIIGIYCDYGIWPSKYSAAIRTEAARRNEACLALAIAALEAPGIKQPRDERFASCSISRHTE